MSYYSRKPEGVFWTEHTARAHKICLGDLNCNGISPGEKYWELRFKRKGRPATFCNKCVVTQKAKFA